jgi:hypothetical protein
VRGRLTEAELRYEQVFDLWRTFYDRHMSTVRAKLELEKRLVLKHPATATLCESAKSMQTLRTDELYQATVDVVAALFDVHRAAVYLSTDGVLRLAVERPAGAPSHSPKLSTEIGPPADAIASLRAITVPNCRLKHSATASGDDFALMAGPLLGADGSVLGVVVSALQLSELSPSAALCFDQFLTWASRALQNSLLYEGIGSGCSSMQSSQQRQ